MNSRLFDLRTEYHTNPIGIGENVPRLSWKLLDDRQEVLQQAYQIQAASTPEQLDKNQPDLWDSGKVESDNSIHVPYGGTALKSRQRIYWKARVWLNTNDGQTSTDWSETAFFETGLLQPSDWKAHWIQTTIVGGPRSIPPCPLIRKVFEVAGQVRQARLYISALGLFECSINGQPISEDVFTPGHTDYSKRVQYMTYDVTSFLQSGANCIGVILGDGWYSGHIHSDPRMFYGDRPRLLAQMEIELEDGSKQVILSDQTWRFTDKGPIRSSDLIQGEDYDARMEIPGWDQPGFDDLNWANVEVWTAPPGLQIVAKCVSPVRRIQELKPVVPAFNPPGKPNRWNFDFGQNMVGRVRLKLRNTRPGQLITIRHAEMLDQGKLYVESLRTARATDYYTCRGVEEEIYEPHFTFHGFRYIEINGLKHAPEIPPADTVTGIVLHNDLESTGTFECSDPMINQLQSNIRWGQKGNFIEIPTDCPQRDERLGWTGDAQVFIRTASFNMNVAPFFTKWIQDIADAQFESGGIPSTVPFCVSIPKEGGPAWSDAAIICPWTIWKCFGDTRILEKHYPMMVRFMDYLERISPGFIRLHEIPQFGGYGDWLNIDSPTPKDYIGTAFFAYDCQLMSQIASALGKNQDVLKYTRLGQQIKQAFRERFTSRGIIQTPSQTAYVLALHFDLLEEKDRPQAFESLVRDIESRNNHLSTGFVGTPYLNHVLTRFGRADLAFALLEQKTYPSWLYPITQGATTMWERWNAYTHEHGFGDASMNSYNHYAYGAVGDWMYAAVAGIDLGSGFCGFKRIHFRPHVGGHLTFARASLESPYGRIESAWEREKDKTKFNFRVPPNTRATIYLPDGSTHEVGSGKYEFVLFNN